MTIYQFNNAVLTIISQLLNHKELQDIGDDELYHFIITELEYRCDNAVGLIKERAEGGELAPCNFWKDENNETN